MFQSLWKIWKSSWDDYSQYMENKKMFQTTNQTCITCRKVILRLLWRVSQHHDVSIHINSDIYYNCKDGSSTLHSLPLVLVAAWPCKKDVARTWRTKRSLSLRFVPGTNGLWHANLFLQTFTKRSWIREVDGKPLEWGLPSRGINPSPGWPKAPPGFWTKNSSGSRSIFIGRGQPWLGWRGKTWW